MAQFLPRRWRRQQPGWYTGINWNRRFATDLRFFLVAIDGGMIDLVTRTRATATSGATTGAVSYPRGRALGADLRASGAYYDFGDNDLWDIGSPGITVVTGFVLTTAVSTNHGLVAKNSGGFNTPFAFFLETSTPAKAQVVIQNAAIGSIWTSSGTVAPNVYTQAAFSRVNGNQLNFYFQGAYSNTATFGNGGATGFGTGNAYPLTVGNLVGFSHFAIGWAGASDYTLTTTGYSPDRVAQMWDSPWELLREYPARRYFDFGGVSGATLTSISPTDCFQNTTQVMVCTGTGFTAQTAAISGTGITINSQNVDSATQITVNYSVDAAAATGTRNVSVGASGNQTLTVKDRTVGTTTHGIAVGRTIWK